MEDDETLRKRIELVRPLLNEAQLRQYYAAEAKAMGRGGVSAVARAAGCSRSTVRAGARDLESGAAHDPSSGRVRRPGAGRKALEERYPGLHEEVLRLVDGERYGSPESPLSWTTKSLRRISAQLKDDLGWSVSHVKVGEVLRAEGFSLQGNRKMEQVGEPHPDRDAQFRRVAEAAAGALASGAPVVSVDCKKKEAVGRFANAGREWRPAGEPTEVLDHDFPLPGLGKAAPYGVYDVGADEGWVSVGVSRDTAHLAVASPRSWWDQMGGERYPDADRVVVTCDGGGSNGSRNRLWKRELQSFCDRNRMEVEVHHLPPGTSKWNKVEHRLFAQITRNWRGRPLESLEVIVSLIASTTTSRGLRVMCEVDPRSYEAGIKVTDEEMDALDISREEFHGEWNYVIRPRNTS